MTRGAKTREAILGAGVELFARYPVDAVTIDDIVNAAVVGKGSFYQHFTSKEGLLGVLVKDIRGEVEAAVKQANAAVTDPACRVVRGSYVNLRFAKLHPIRAAVLFRNEFSRAFTSAFDLYADAFRDVTAGRATGRFRLASDEAGVAVIVGIGRMMMLQLLADTDRGIHSHASELGSSMLRGLGLEIAEADAISTAMARDVLG